VVKCEQSLDVNRLCTLTYSVQEAWWSGVTTVDLTERKATWWPRSTELDSYLQGCEFDRRLDLCKNVSRSQAENVTSTKDKEFWKYEY
jgi:hypothetical protein